MKITSLMFCLGLVMTQACAQKTNEKDVPQAAKNSLDQKFSAKNVKWEKEDDNYEANFKQNGIEISVVVSASGTILETEKEINKSDLPIAVLDQLKKDYSDYKIEETTSIESNGVLTYEVEVEKGKESFDLIFDAEGLLIKKVENEGDEEED